MTTDQNTDATKKGMSDEWRLGRLAYKAFYNQAIDPAFETRPKEYCQKWCDVAGAVACAVHAMQSTSESRGASLSEEELGRLCYREFNNEWPWADLDKKQQAFYVKKAQRLARTFRESLMKREGECWWKLDKSFGYYHTGCHQAYEFTDGGTYAQHRFTHCPFCGLPIKETSTKEL